MNNKYFDFAKTVLKMEAQAILSLVDRIGPAFSQACELILDCNGCVVVSGVGKAGLVGRKISATMASTGTKSVCCKESIGLHRAHNGIGLR